MTTLKRTTPTGDRWTFNAYFIDCIRAVLRLAPLYEGSDIGERGPRASHAAANRKARRALREHDAREHARIMGDA